MMQCTGLRCSLWQSFELYPSVAQIWNIPRRSSQIWSAYEGRAQNREGGEKETLYSFFERPRRMMQFRLSLKPEQRPHSSSPVSTTPDPEKLIE
ncbi:hypothetical protein Bca4012_067592 [Brassica carinata]|uniref:Uncharacterized protein n=1 Tax=Brassica carinata TaxID=52824 RepID=A0A8X8AZ12_BRACI|nr:hypothetical protein Bca52824_019872 [Brassica carinata]